MRSICSLILLSCCLAGAPADSVDELDAACPLLYVCELRRDSGSEGTVRAFHLTKRCYKKECKDHRGSRGPIEGAMRCQVHGAVHKCPEIRAILVDSVFQRWMCCLQTHDSFNE